MMGSLVRRCASGSVAAVLLAGGMAGLAATAAHATPFSMSLVGGTFSLASQGSTSIGGSSTACQNGADDEMAAPFGTPDGLVDFPADPQCANAYDNDEAVAGYQAPDPVEFSGTIDGASNFSASSSFVPIAFVRTSASPTAGVCDGDQLVVKATTGFTETAPATGNLVGGTLSLHLELNTALDIQCDTDLTAGTNFVAFDFDGPGGMNPWGGATPVLCTHDVSSTNTSASGDSAPASLTKVQDPAVTSPMSGGTLEPMLVFGDVFSANPVATADTRCPFFEAFVFGTSSINNSAVQFAFMVDNRNYIDKPGIDVNIGDVMVPEGDGGLGAHGCAGIDCRNSASVIVTLSSPALVDSTISVIADNTTGGNANGTLKGTEIVAPGPADYKATPASKPKVLMIKAGKSTAKFSIAITPDQTVESSENIIVKVVAVSAGRVVNDGYGVVTIADDDGGAEPDTGINVGDATVYETGSAVACGVTLRCKGTAIIPIVASSPVALDTNLTYTITNGSDVVGVFTAATAVDGKTVTDDFLPVNIGKVKLLRTGKNTLALVITILGDNTLELGTFSGETLTVTVTGTGVRDGIGTVRILNDDI